MTDKEVTQLINNEFKVKSLGVTEQYLEIHQPVYDNGELKIERIDREKQDVIIAYLPVKDEYFFFAVYIDPIKKEIFNVGTESRNIVTLRATSEKFTSNELQSFLKLSPDKTWNKGDIKSRGKSVYNFSCVEYELNPEPDKFEDKLRKLLNQLQKDRESILALGMNADTYIQIIMDFHAGNQLLGSASIDLECIKIMNELNLQISFDFTA
jgi:hypothetical protein